LDPPPELVPHRCALRHLLGDDDCGAADNALPGCGDKLEECIAFPCAVPEQMHDVALGVEASAAWEHGSSGATGRSHASGPYGVGASARHVHSAWQCERENHAHGHAVASSVGTFALA